jgi:hypothetical protein
VGKDSLRQWCAEFLDNVSYQIEDQERRQLSTISRIETARGLSLIHIMEMNSCCMHRLARGEITSYEF